MAIDPRSSLADLVTERPRRAAILEELGLDFCCGGDRTLAEACAEARLDVATVVDRLSGAADDPPADWSSMEPPELIDHLEATHHAYLRAALPQLTQLAEKVAGVHGDTHPELHDVARTHAELRADLEPHLLKEEQVLFPMVRELYATTDVPAFHCGSLRNPIGVMEAEHDRAGALLARLRSLTSAYTPPSDACASYTALYAGLAELEADTHLHVHKENNLLFPAVVAEEMRRAAG